MRVAGGHIGAGGLKKSPFVKKHLVLVSLFGHDLVPLVQCILRVGEGELELLHEAEVAGSHFPAVRWGLIDNGPALIEWYVLYKALVLYVYIVILLLFFIQISAMIRIVNKKIVKFPIILMINVLKAVFWIRFIFIRIRHQINLTKFVFHFYQKCNAPIND